MSATPVPLVSSLLGDAAFAHARVLAGARGLERFVEGLAIGQSGSPPSAFRDALLLVGPDIGAADLGALVRQAAVSDAAALVFIEPGDGAAPDAVVIGRANDAGLPLISLPRRSDWHAVVRAANRLLLRRHADRTPSIAASTDSTVTPIHGLVRRLCDAAEEEAAAIYWRTIGPLDQYDEQRGAALVDTLAVFFSWDENVERTAEAMAAHRHTIRYRLGRIAEITGLSPYRTGDKSLLWLGLQLRDLLRMAPGDEPRPVMRVAR